MKPTTTSYIKGWLLFSVIEFLVGIAFSLTFMLLRQRVFDPAQLPLLDVELVKFVAGLVVGLPISFFVYRWSVGRYIIRSLESSATPDRAA